MPKWTVIDGILHQVFCGCDEEWDLSQGIRYPRWQDPLLDTPKWCPVCDLYMWRHDDSYLKGV